MERLEQARLREQQRINPDSIKPVVVKSVDHLKRVIAELAPGQEHSAVPVPAQLNMQTENGMATVDVAVPTKSRSKRQIILEAIEILRNRRAAAEQSQFLESLSISVNGRDLLPLNPFAEDHKMAIDDLIYRWTGGSRRGEYIYWTIGEAEYKYDIYNHKLTKIVQTKNA